MKKVIRLTEQDLHRIVRQSVDEAVDEGLWGRLTGGVKGGYQAAKALTNMNRKNITPINNRKTNWSKIKKTMANQAADSDRNQEFKSLINKLEKLQLNGYLDGQEEIYNDVNSLITKLQNYMTSEGYRTEAQYKKNFGQDHPDKIARHTPKYTSNGMGYSRRNSSVTPGYAGAGV